MPYDNNSMQEAFDKAVKSKSFTGDKGIIMDVPASKTMNFGGQEIPAPKPRKDPMIVDVEPTAKEIDFGGQKIKLSPKYRGDSMKMEKKGGSINLKDCKVSTHEKHKGSKGW